MIKCLIVDDETKARENLSILIKEFCPMFEIVGEAWDKDSIQQVLYKSEADVLFLDVEIGNNTIFDILDYSIVKDYKVVLVTAHDNYAKKGYDLKAVDYLLKPVSAISLKNIYDFIVKSTLSHKKESSFKLSPVDIDPKIKLSDSTGIHYVELEEILYCIGEGTYSTFHFKNNNRKVISKNLKHFEQKLEGYNFFRINKSNLINLKYVEIYNKVDGGYIVMKDGTKLTVSKHQKKALIEALESFTI